MEVSSWSWSTQTQQCHSCISSVACVTAHCEYYITSASEWRWTLSCFSQGSSPGQGCSLAFSISFHNRQELFPSPPGCRCSPTSYQAVTPGQLQSCKHFESARLHSEGDGPGKAGAASPPSSTAAPAGTTSGHP